MTNYTNEEIITWAEKDKKNEELVEWIVEHMDLSALEAYVTEDMQKYYASPEGEDDFENNYTEMKEMKGDE